MAELKAKRRLSNITFEHEGAHVALVSTKQGGPANGVTTLITKSSQLESEVHQMTLEERKARLGEIQAQIETLDKEAQSLVSIEELMIEHLSRKYETDVPNPVQRTQPYLSNNGTTKSVDRTTELLKAKYN
jgi:predicted transcriptional regulator